MARVYADRVAESSTTTGTGAFTLAGALASHRAFSAVCSVSDTVGYLIEGISGGALTGEWEIGVGTYSATNTLTRTTVVTGSNGASAVNFSAGTKRVALVMLAADIGTGGGGAWRLEGGPLDGEAPASNYATLDSRNGHPVLDFDATTSESAIWTRALPSDYGGAGITVNIWCAASTATSGTIGWLVSIERIDASSLDIDADSFASANTVTAVTVPGTSGQVLKMSVNISNGANMDSLAAGELFRIKIARDTASDTAAGDAELLRWDMVEQ